jgi:hypothetical protein
MNLVKSAVVVAVFALAPFVALADECKAPSSQPDGCKKVCPADADKACCPAEKSGCAKADGCKKDAAKAGCKVDGACKKEAAKAACKCEGECKCASGDKSACKCEGECKCGQKAKSCPVTGKTAADKPAKAGCCPHAAK